LNLYPKNNQESGGQAGACDEKKPKVVNLVQMYLQGIVAPV
jgi:hypothetical protein